MGGKGLRIRTIVAEKYLWKCCGWERAKNLKSIYQLKTVIEMWVPEEEICFETVLLSDSSTSGGHLSKV